ncbi:DUF4440 domain-containing protein [Leptobacterium flavescens]|uniref:DUF4440 domain-containing protein n=1 Tax=Leptobacterium flavescens TaxID=472055 RepID=A0A6P0UNH4_9FLAO|nr:nuclear transport factor 2 family protein [Leptobacterium flavescens]NER14725.1 DUF4440 domain-containing protein [Leptobacterium flavescens]
MKQYPIILLLFLLMLSCKEENKSRPEAEIKKEIAGVFDAYVNQLNTQGLKGIDSYFSKDDRFYWVEDGLLQYPDRAALLEGIEAFYPSVRSVHMTVSGINIHVIDDNTATLFSLYKQDFVLNTGYSFHLEGAFTILLTPEDDSWKFLIGHSSVKKPRDTDQ